MFFRHLCKVVTDFIIINLSFAQSTGSDTEIACIRSFEKSSLKAQIVGIYIFEVFSHVSFFTITNYKIFSRIIAFDYFIYGQTFFGDIPLSEIGFLFEFFTP